MIVAASMSGFKKTHLLLRLDSGSNAAMLHAANPQMKMMLNPATPTLRRAVEGIEQVFAVLPGQDLEVGKHRFHEISFAVPVNSVGNGPLPREDGVLPPLHFNAYLSVPPLATPSLNHGDVRPPLPLINNGAVKLAS